MRKWISLLVVVLALACSKRSETPLPEARPKPQPKAATTTAPQMPAYKARNLDGSEFDLQAKKGTVLLLNLWATWCGPCRHEIPELEKVHAKYNSRGFAVVGISVDESVEAVHDYVKEKPIGYPLVLDPEGKMAGFLEVSVLPTSVIVDRSGKMVWRSVGIVSASDTKMIKALEEALAGTS